MACADLYVRRMSKRGILQLDFFWIIECSCEGLCKFCPYACNVSMHNKTPKKYILLSKTFCQKNLSFLFLCIVTTVFMKWILSTTVFHMTASCCKLLVWTKRPKGTSVRTVAIFFWRYCGRETFRLSCGNRHYECWQSRSAEVQWIIVLQHNWVPFSLCDMFHFSVSTSNSASCDDTAVQVDAGEGYIAGGLLPDSRAQSPASPPAASSSSNSRGTSSSSSSSGAGCSWVIAAQSGQRINLTMINFDYKGVTGHRRGYRRRGHTGVSCTDVAMVTDAETKQNIRLCEDQPRETQAYLSTADTIELQIYNRALPSSKTQSKNGLFLLQYKGKSGSLLSD